MENYSLSLALFDYIPVLLSIFGLSLLAQLNARVLPASRQLLWAAVALVTAGGLYFTGATMDKYFRAFDTATGEEIWRVRTPFAGNAAPMSYRLGKNHKQYVVIAAGGNPLTGSGDALLAFTTVGSVGELACRPGRPRPARAPRGSFPIKLSALAAESGERAGGRKLGCPTTGAARTAAKRLGSRSGFRVK